MLNPFRIRQQLAEALGEKGAEAVTGVLSTLYDELAQEVRREDFSQLRSTMEGLAKAGKRTDERLESLATRIEEPAEAQTRTEQRLGSLAAGVGALTVRLDALTARVDRLAEAQLETERRMQKLLRVVGESKAQLSTTKIDQFLERRVTPLTSEGREPFPLIICRMTAEPGVVEYARERGVAVYLSYELE